MKLTFRASALRDRSEVDDCGSCMCLHSEGSYEKPYLTTFPNTEKRVENTTRSGVFLTNFEVFGNVVKHGLEYLIYLLNLN